MRRLLPDQADDVDLDEAYAIPDPHRRHVRANFISSADGAAEVGGRSGGLSTDADHRVFSVLRGHCDAVLVGATTARREGYGPARPSAARREWRQEHGLSPVPPLVVVTSRVELDLETAFFTEAVSRPVILTTDAAPAERRRQAAAVAEVVTSGNTMVDMGTALEALAERGLMHVLCEGGPHLFGQLAMAGLLDELCLSLAPVLAGADHLRIIGGPELGKPVELELAHVLTAEGTLFLRYVVSHT